MLYRVIKKSLCTWRLQSPHNWWFEDGHHRIQWECRPCYTEHGLREHSSACQYISGHRRGTLWTLLVTFCVVIIRRTETFWSPCIIPTHEFVFSCTQLVSKEMKILRSFGFLLFRKLSSAIEFCTLLCSGMSRCLVYFWNSRCRIFGTGFL